MSKFLAHMLQPLSFKHKGNKCVFCDASTSAIAAVAYSRITSMNGKVEVGVMFGKAKLAPRPEISVPRLEQCAAVLAVEIAETIED